MNTMLTVAELLAGEALVTPGGAVDRVTAAADEYPLFADAGAQGEPAATIPGAPDNATPAVEQVLLPV
jgi:hypothetical protein